MYGSSDSSARGGLSRLLSHLPAIIVLLRLLRYVPPLGNVLLCLIPKHKNIPDLKKGILWKCVSLRGALCQCKAESTIRKTKAFLSLVGRLAGRPHGCPPPPSLSLHVTLSPCESENWGVRFDIFTWSFKRRPNFFSNGCYGGHLPEIE